MAHNYTRTGSNMIIIVCIIITILDYNNIIVI